MLEAILNCSPLYFLRQVPSLNLNSPIQLGWQSSRPHACSCFLSTWIIDMLHPAIVGSGEPILGSQDYAANTILTEPLPQPLFTTIFMSFCSSIYK